MPTTLYGRLAAVLLVLFLLLGTAFITVARHAFDLYQRETSQRFNAGLARQIVSETHLMLDRRVNQAALHAVFSQIMVVNPSIEVYLLDPGGRILAFSAPPGKVVRQAVSLDPVHAMLDARPQLPIEGDDPRSATGKKLFSVAPIVVRATLQGYLYVILGGEEYTGLADMLHASYILRLSVAAVVLSLLFALVAGIASFALLTGRLRRLGAGLERFRASDFTQPPPAAPGGRRRDEIDRLQQGFHDMGERIVAQMEKLTVADKLRRELVTNVSHDLRTPLAAMQGYLETLARKRATLSPAEQQEYLDIARKHSERLAALVDELFELAKLDSNEVQPQRETFAVAELLQDVAQEFRLAAEAKGVRLETALRGAHPFVSADIALIERALENLIDNALRYTPAQGRVTLSLGSDATHALIEVSDTGCGIPENERPYIFERFYRAANNGASSHNGAGLGLAIAKRILDLHAGTLEVDSNHPTGAVLRVRLPLAAPARA